MPGVVRKQTTNNLRKHKKTDNVQKVRDSRGSNPPLPERGRTKVKLGAGCDGGRVALLTQTGGESGPLSAILADRNARTLLFCQVQGN